MAVLGSGPPSVLAILVLTGIGTVLWNREHSPEDVPMFGGDLPVRLVRWAIGLLPADRDDWGQAMLGELDHVEGASRRWRFALGCMAGVVLLPPWGLVTPMTAIVGLALGSAVVCAIGFVHFGLAANPWNWMVLAILAVLVIGSIVAVSVQLRRPGVARLGLLGGLFVAATSLAFSGFTFSGIVDPIASPAGAWSGPALMIAVPLVVGVGIALCSGSALVGRRAARLAGCSAGLAMFFVSTIAVVAIDGGPRDPGVGVAGGVSEAFFNVAKLYLVFLPLATAAIGWVAATATGRLRYGTVAHRGSGSMGASNAVESAAEGSSSRTTGPGVLLPIAAAAIVVAFTLLFLIK
ncbi:MAG: hypothetical protein ACYDA2_01515 [Acidimicrobiales bacterium]